MLSTLPPERRFDFWLGDWDVTWGEGQRGRNRVARILEGRVIREEFDGGPGLPFRGMSVSVYVEKLGRWRQTWVDTEGNYWTFEGGLVDGQMILETDDILEGRAIKLRMVFYNIREDELDWRWERSEDGGHSWETRWQIHYRRRREKSGGEAAG